MATGFVFDVPVSEIIDAISSYKPANNRSQVVDTGKNILDHAIPTMPILQAWRRP